ncbi:hypothetical protein KJA17_02575 [Patescibacteria group bacterium]|nr:hypothetical protein [Patescibacteria group bacterium]
MFNLFLKFIFLRKKPKVIVVGGVSSSLAVAAIFQVLKNFFKVKKIEEKVRFKDISKNDILIFDFSKLSPPKKFKFWLKNSSLPILAISSLGEIPPSEIIFASPRSPELENLAQFLPSFSYLILNFDDETVRSIGDKLNVNQITFGFDQGSDFQVIDLRINKNGTNFKLNFEGNILPIWLRNLFGKKNIYSVLAAVCVGYTLNLNLVRLSRNLKSYQGVEGEGKLIEGIKNSFLLDDSKNASPFSMNEMLGILGKIGKEGRKIAVLGDILGIGKYTIEAHEAIGEKVVQNADLLFTVGARAKFIAKGAREKGMEARTIFEFDETSRAEIALQKEIREGDLILIDGSTEMEMPDIIKEVKRI